MSSSETEASGSFAKLLVQDFAIKLEQPCLCELAEMEAAEKSLRNALLDASTESFDVVFDLENIKTIAELFKELSALAKNLEKPGTDTMALNDFERTLVRFQKSASQAARAIIGQGVISLVDTAALLHISAVLKSCVAKLQKFRVQCERAVLVDNIAPAVAGLQMIVQSMGHELTFLPPAPLVERLQNILDCTAPQTFHDNHSIASVRAWVKSVLDVLEKKISKVAEMPQEDAAHVCLLDHVTSVTADLQHQFFASSCSHRSS